ncbi:MAG: Hpt domain-containing protein [Prochlorotrichaceae cyanobacterium]|jgi:HPt (histidine-containing phosphotransfer) domain-containing protein
MANTSGDQLEQLLEPNHEPAIDRSVLELNLGALGDEIEECIGFLTETFLEDVPDLLGAIHQGLEDGNANEVRFNVHTLKSSSATLGATHLAKLCLMLENQSKVGDLSHGVPLHKAIEVEFERVKAGLLKIVNHE